MRRLRVGVGAAEAARVLRVAFDLRGPPVVAFDQHRQRAAGARDAGRVEGGLAGDDVADLARPARPRTAESGCPAGGSRRRREAERRGRQREELAAVQRGRFGVVVERLRFAELVVDVGETGELFGANVAELRRVRQVFEAAMYVGRLPSRIIGGTPGSSSAAFTCKSF